MHPNTAGVNGLSLLYFSHNPQGKSQIKKKKKKNLKGHCQTPQKKKVGIYLRKSKVLKTFGGAIHRNNHFRNASLLKKRYCTITFASW